MSGDHMKSSFAKLWLAIAGLLLIVPLLAGCREEDNTVMLGIEGYNYTDRYIDRFSVGGAGGGNISLSTATSGGGGTVCCIGYDPDRALPITLRVEWMFGYELDEHGEISIPDEHHKAMAVLNGPVPEDPRFLEVHFMPDGSVRLMMTAERSAPLVYVDRSGSAREGKNDG